MIGNLRHLVTFERQRDGDSSSAGDRSGSFYTTWEDVPVSIRQLSMREMELARQHIASATHKIELRYHPNISVRDRIIFGERTFEVGSINNVDERNRWLELIVSEEV